MINSVASNVKANDVLEPQEEAKQQYNMTYRGNDFERTPDNDNYESSHKTGKTIGIIAGALVLLAGAGALFVTHRGKNVLNKSDATFKEKFVAGWKDIFKKGVKKVEINDESIKEYLSGLPEDTQKEVIETIEDAKSFGANLSFGIDDNGSKVLNVDFGLDCYKNFMNEVFKEIPKDKKLLTKTLSDIATKKAETLPKRFSLNLSSMEAYKESDNAADKVFDKLMSEIDTEFCNLLHEDKKLAKNILKEFFGEEKTANLKDSELEEFISQLIEELE